MRFFFRLLYHPFAWTYDFVAAAVSLGRWKGWVVSTTDLLQGPRVLELGFGPGHLQTHLRRQGWQAAGLDESLQMIQQASGRLARSGFAPQLARGLAQALPYASESFDCVVATFPTLYIVDPQTLLEIQRVLRPGGRLVVLMVAWLTGPSIVEKLMHFVFRVTAQAPPDDWDASRAIQPYVDAGFEAHIAFKETAGSRLLFIIAEKK